MKVHFSDTIPLPVSRVFDAITDHVKMSKYFISGANSSIVEGRKILWEWEDEDAQHEIHVLKVIKDQQIIFEWEATGKITTTDISLSSEDKDHTRVSITETEWDNDDASCSHALGQMRGWTDFFNSLKAYLLFNVNLRSGKRL